MIERKIYFDNVHFLRLYIAGQQQNGMPRMLLKMTLPTRGISSNENFVHISLMVEMDINFEIRQNTLSVLKRNPLKHGCREFIKKSMTKFGLQSTSLGPLPLKERLQTIKSNSIGMKKNISLGSKDLAPNSLKQCAYKRMLEHLNTTSEQLTTHLINKDLCYALSAAGEEFCSSIGKLVGIDKQLKCLQEALELHSANALNLNRKWF